MSTGEELNQYLTKSSCYCLNEDSRSNYNNLFMGDHTLVLKSDADEQLLLQLAFQQTVNIRRLHLGLPADDSCPQTVKLFANKLNLGFSEASGENTESLCLLEISWFFRARTHSDFHFHASGSPDYHHIRLIRSEVAAGGVR